MHIGRFLGIAESASNIITAGTVQCITHIEQHTDLVRQQMNKFNTKIVDKFKEGRLHQDGDKPVLQEWEDLLGEDPDFAAEFNRLFENTEVPEADDTFDPDSFDTYLNIQISIDRGGEHPMSARVTKRMKDHEGKPIGTAHQNPILDTRMYEVKYANGFKQAMSANVIAENMFASVDEEGH